MMTLQQIRDQSPCTEGWTKLLKSLNNPPMDTVISLGDVAFSNGAADAWWCVRALDWDNEQVRREVIKALLPSVKRAVNQTKDARVHDCILTIEDWIDGKPADLGAAAGAAARAARSAAGAAWRAADAAAEAAAEAAWRAADAAAEAAEAADAADAAEAADAADAAARAARAAGAARSAELKGQREDIIAAFPPLVLCQTRAALKGGKKDG